MRALILFRILNDKKSMEGGSFIYTQCEKIDIKTPELFTEEQKMVKSMILDFIDQEVLPKIELIDAMSDKTLMPTILRKSGELGMMGVNIPNEYEGMDMDMLSTLIFGEATAYGYSYATAIGAHTSIGTLPIVYYGSKSQKKKYLPHLASGKMLSAYCLTEPHAGSDANAGRTRAILNKEKTHYFLNGQKMWITNGGFADIFIVFAKIDEDKNLSAFIVEKNFGGITIGPEERKFGIKGSSTVQLFFNNTEVPVENLLGKRQGGFKMALNILNSGRLKIGASSIGGSKVALQKSVQYALDRKQFGKSIASFGAIQKKIAEMVVYTYATESTTYRIGGQIDAYYERLLSEGVLKDEAKRQAAREFAIECSIAKVYGSEVLCKITDEAIQIHGGMGYAEETGVVRGYRDARITKIYEGTNEVNRLLIIGELMKRGFQTKTLRLNGALKKTPLYVLQACIPFQSITLKKRLIRLKHLFLILLAAVTTKFKVSLINEQEVVMQLSDILTEICVFESSYLRSESIAENSKDKLINKTIVKVIAYEVFNKTEIAAKEIINSSFDGWKNKLLKRLITLFLPNYNLNVKAYRREIAKYALEKNGYGITP